MNYHCAKLCLVSLIFALVAPHCWCFSTVQVKKTPEQRVLPRVTCSARRIRAVFGPQVKSNIHVKDVTGATIPVPLSEGSCGMRLSRERNQSLSLLSRYDSCYAHIEGSRVIIPLQVQLTGEDRWFRVNISCPLIKRHSEKTRLIPTPSPGDCDIERALRVDCGYHNISSDACYKLGCCYDASDLTCYYKLNACSLDGHFVFLIKATDTDPPVDPSKLVIKDQPQCYPVITTPDAAVFKIGVMDCGAKMKVDGNVKVYEVEVEELDTKSRTKSSPFSLQVQCEYKASDLKHAVDLRALNSITNPPPVVAQGTFRVQMKIAKDASFTSFFPEDQLPLTLPLRETVYVEISIAQPSPDPTLSLRVRDCFAYPESRHSVWTLLYDGCPNPKDNLKSSIPVDKYGKTISLSQIRRFDVKTFAFWDPHTGHQSTEEIYFYCWVEMCTDDDDDCAQSCTFYSPKFDRQKREATSEHQVKLVSFGPLLSGQNNTKQDNNPCSKQNTTFKVTVYMLCGVSAALLLIVLFVAWSSIRKCQKPEAEQASDAKVDGEESQ